MTLSEMWSQRPLVAGRWTLKDVVQGKPLRHPSHPLFVHFPSALLPAAFIFDVLSRIDADLTFTRAAFYNISLGLTVAGFAAITGLVDYLPMVGGSRKKVLGTRHLIWAADCGVLLRPEPASARLRLRRHADGDGADAAGGCGCGRAQHRQLLRRRVGLPPGDARQHGPLTNAQEQA